MHIIEPCCAQRQIGDLRKALGSGGRDKIRGLGDMSLTELLPALLTCYNETELLIAAPSIPDQAAEIIARWARHQWARMDGSGSFYELRRLTIIADLSEEKSPVASGWLKENPFGERLVLADKTQGDTALLLPDIAFTGPLNLRYGHEFTCSVTTVREEIEALWKQYARMARIARRTVVKPVVKREEKTSDEAAKPAVADTSGKEPAGEETSTR